MKQRWPQSLLDGEQAEAEVAEDTRQFSYKSNMSCYCMNIFDDTSQFSLSFCFQNIFDDASQLSLEPAR